LILIKNFDNNKKKTLILIEILKYKKNINIYKFIWYKIKKILLFNKIKKYKIKMINWTKI